MEAKFKSFIEKLETSNNKSVLEAVQSGYLAIFEGYADVRDVEHEDALVMFNRQAANVALGQGNPVLQFLQNSAEQTSQMYSFDDETELDDNDTIDYREYIIPTPDKVSYADSLGLTASDLADDAPKRKQIDNDLGIDFQLDF